MTRALIAGITYGAAFFASPWIVLIGAGVLSARWRAWEVIVLGLIVDLLYVPLGGFLGVPFPATLSALIIVWGMEPFRRELYE